MIFLLLLAWWPVVLAVADFQNQGKIEGKITKQFYPFLTKGARSVIGPWQARVANLFGP